MDSKIERCSGTGFVYCRSTYTCGFSAHRTLFAVQYLLKVAMHGYSKYLRNTGQNRFHLPSPLIPVILQAKWSSDSFKLSRTSSVELDGTTRPCIATFKRDCTVSLPALTSVDVFVESLATVFPLVWRPLGTSASVGVRTVSIIAADYGEVTASHRVRAPSSILSLTYFCETVTVAAISMGSY